MSNDELAALEDRRHRAMIDADIPVLDELCSADLVYTHSNSSRDSKESYLRKVADGYFDYRWVDHPVDGIVFAGDTALISGSMVGEVIIDGVLKKLNSKTLTVWVRQGGDWRLAAFAPTPIPS